VLASFGIHQSYPTVDLPGNPPPPTGDVFSINQPVVFDLSAICQLSPVSPYDLAANGSSSIQSPSCFALKRNFGTRNNDSRLASGHDAPTSITEGKPTDTKFERKKGKKGHEQGAVACGAEEHPFLFHVLGSSSPRNVQVLLLHWGSPTRTLSTFLSHLVEMHGTMKKGARFLSLSYGGPKRPTSYL
jgi:hypothetical protein